MRGRVPLRFFENLFQVDRTRSKMLTEYHFYLRSWSHPRHQLSPLDMRRSALFLEVHPLAASTPTPTYWAMAGARKGGSPGGVTAFAAPERHWSYL